MKKFYLMYFDNNMQELLGEFNTYEEAEDMVRRLEDENPNKYMGHICMPYERFVKD